MQPRCRARGFLGGVTYLVFGLSGCDDGSRTTRVVTVDGGVIEAPTEDAGTPCLQTEPSCAGPAAVEWCENGVLMSRGCDEGMICDDGVCEPCPKVQFSVQTTQSCALEVSTDGELDGESFINVGGDDYRVLAMDRWGEGHIFAWCDWSSFNQVLTQFDVFKYAGQVDSPRVLSFGDPNTCNPAYTGNGCYDPPDTCVPPPDTVTYVGEDLPAQYENNAEL